VIDVEPLIRSHLDRLASLPATSHRDWADVLERAGSRRRLRGRGSFRRAVVVLVLGVVALGLFVAAPALGIRPVAEVFGDEPTPSWTWPEGVPGEPIKPPEIVRGMNETAGTRLLPRVDLATLREVVSAGNGRAAESILAARGVNGDVCLTEVAGDGSRGGAFRCVHDEAPAGGLTPLQQGVFLAASGGGHRGSVVDYATVLGVVRSDVGLVELELQDGETIELPLNRWRSFGYSTTEPRRFPKTLTIYRTWSSLFSHHEKLLGAVPLATEDVAPSPLCGGRYGPCPSGVRP
jgi:hypothetical protein